MKKKILVGVLVGAVIFSSMVFLGRGVFASSPSSTTTQPAVTATQETDSNKQEPSYVGSIKVDEKANVSEQDESASLLQLAKISQSEAEKAALAKVQGSVVKTTLDNENGYLVYSVSVKDASGKISDVKVDAGNGSVLSVEAQDSEAEKETAEETSTQKDLDTIQEGSQVEGND